MQRLSGHGTAFLEFDGHVVEYNLQPGQQIVVDTGYLAAMDATCSMEIKTVPGLKNMVFGGEGVFNTLITGPGTCMASDYANLRRCGRDIEIYAGRQIENAGGCPD